MFSKNKFGSRKKKDKPKMDGYTFDSMPEMNRYAELKMMQKAGLISDLEVHPVYELAKGVKNNFGQHIYCWKYKADFAYRDVKGNCQCVEDVKSLRINKKGKKYGTSQSRDYKLTRNEFMRQNLNMKFIETY